MTFTIYGHMFIYESTHGKGSKILGKGIIMCVATFIIRLNTWFETSSNGCTIDTILSPIVPVYALQRHHIRAPPPYSFWQAQTEDMNLEDMNLTTVGLLGRGVDSPDRARGPLRASLDPWALFLYIMKLRRYYYSSHLSLSYTPLLTRA